MSATNPKTHRLVKVVDGAMVPFEQSIIVDGVQWWLDEEYRQPGISCPRAGDARAPVLDRSTLYVAASGLASGLNGHGDRLSAPTSIVRIPSTGEPPTIVGAGFRRVRDLAISHDGTMLAVAGARGVDESCWLIDLDGETMSNVDIPSADFLSFAPSGKQIVATADGVPVFADVTA